MKSSVGPPASRKYLTLLIRVITSADLWIKPRLGLRYLPKGALAVDKRPFTTSFFVAIGRRRRHCSSQKVAVHNSVTRTFGTRNQTGIKVFFYTPPLSLNNDWRIITPVDFMHGKKYDRDLFSWS